MSLMARLATLKKRVTTDSCESASPDPPSLTFHASRTRDSLILRPSPASPIKFQSGCLTQTIMQAHVFHKKSSIMLSTSYPTSRKRSKNVASSPNHGFRAPENIFSARYTSAGLLTRGRTLFRIPLLRLDVTPDRCSSLTWTLS